MSTWVTRIDHRGRTPFYVKLLLPIEFYRKVLKLTRFSHIFELFIMRIFICGHFQKIDLLNPNLIRLSCI